MRLLIKSGADINKRDDNLRSHTATTTPLHTHPTDHSSAGAPVRRIGVLHGPD